jgi:hypothetical protein
VARKRLGDVPLREVPPQYAFDRGERGRLGIQAERRKSGTLGGDEPKPLPCRSGLATGLVNARTSALGRVKLARWELTSGRITGGMTTMRLDLDGQDAPDATAPAMTRWNAKNLARFTKVRTGSGYITIKSSAAKLRA